MSTLIIQPENQYGKTSEKKINLERGETDNSLATRFADAHCHELRYVREWRKWLCWDGTRWLADPSETRILGIARDFAEGLWQSIGKLASSGATRDEISKATTAIRHANSLKGLVAMLKLSQADSRITIDASELNRQTNLLNVLNGTVDLATGLLQPHDPEDLLTQMANVHFGEQADAPQWLDTLDTIFAGDAQIIRYVQQLLGYSLSGDTGEHILPIAFGGGCNGKSTIWNVVLSLLGDYAALANDTLLMGERNAHPTEKASLYQRRFVALSEPEQSARLRESRVKELTGDGTITARRMHEDFWSFERTHTFWLSTNHLPRIDGNDEGIWRRVKLIPFTVDLREVTSPIPNLDKLLLEAEGAGILNWLLAGYLDYQRSGFIEPDCVKSATGEYREQEDELLSWVSDCCIVAPHCMASATKLFESYQSWGGKHSRTAFGKALAEKYRKDRPDSGAFRKQTIYHGIGIPE